MFPHKISNVDDSINQQLLKYFKGRKTDFIQVGEKKFLLPKKYIEHAENFYNFELRKDDVWIVTFPRSGTSVTQELIWLINNNLDFNSSAKIPLIDRFPYFEFNIVSDDEFLKELAEQNPNSTQAAEEIKKRNTPGYELGCTMKSPRHFKTHLPLSLLPPKLLDTCKVVYVARNPYDVAVSFYHHNRRVKAHDFQGDFRKYWDLFEKDLVIYSPYWQHVQEGWLNRQNPNLFFMFYENLITDKPTVIQNLAKFLDKELSKDNLNKLIEHIKYENFQKNVKIMRDPGLVGLVNKETVSQQRGIVGGKAEFTNNRELNELADQWFKKNSSTIGVDFPILPEP